jgi:uncharacterized membrane protein YecN with MAPEG domain
MLLPITLTIAGAAALINVWLGWRVSALRRGLKVSVGDGGHDVITRRMRAHANFVEYTPLFLILLGLVEASGRAGSWLWWVAILYVLGRLAHPFGMDRPGASLPRIFGIVVTWAMLIGLAGYAIALAYGAAATPAPGITYAGGTKLT